MANGKTKVEVVDPNKVFFEFRGVQLHIHTGEDMSIDALKAYEDGKTATFLECVLDEGQYADLRAKGHLKTVKDMLELVGEVAKAMGTTAGE